MIDFRNVFLNIVRIEVNKSVPRIASQIVGRVIFACVSTNEELALGESLKDFEATWFDGIIAQSAK